MQKLDSTTTIKWKLAARVFVWVLFVLLFFISMYYTSVVYRNYHQILNLRHENNAIRVNQTTMMFNDSMYSFSNVTKLANQMYEFLKINPSCWWSYGCELSQSAVSLTYQCNATSVRFFRDAKLHLDVFSNEVSNGHIIELPSVSSFEIDLDRSMSCSIDASLTCRILFYFMFYYLSYEPVIVPVLFVCSMCYYFVWYPFVLLVLSQLKQKAEAKVIAHIESDEFQRLPDVLDDQYQVYQYQPQHEHNVRQRIGHSVTY